MLIKYHGQICEATSELEDGERELDLFENDTNLEDTMKFTDISLDDTIKINTEEIKKVIKEDDHE